MRLLQEYTQDGVDILHLGGDIDMHFAPTLRAVLRAKHNRNCPALLLDLSQVEFIDSVGLAALLEYLRDATDCGSRFCIGGLSESLRTIFEVVGLGKVMPVYADSAKAKAAFLADDVPEPSMRLFAEAA
ncbi:MAG TPA: STAS domain-containing protein [Chthoniobacterales bacterium]